MSAKARIHQTAVINPFALPAALPPELLPMKHAAIHNAPAAFYYVRQPACATYGKHTIGIAVLRRGDGQFDVAHLLLQPTTFEMQLAVIDPAQFDTLDDAEFVLAVVRRDVIAFSDKLNAALDAIVAPRLLKVMFWNDSVTGMSMEGGGVHYQQSF